MKAIILKQGGDSRVLKYAETPKPNISANQVLVAVKAVGVNPIDVKIRETPDRFPVTMPCIPGCDAAGIVLKIGNEVKHLKLGDEVFFSQPGFNARQGTYAEFVAVDATLVAIKPQTLSFTQAAIAPLVLITAWEALYHRARIQPGQTVLIQGGAGGVGHVAIQLAKLAGAQVATTVAGTDKVEFVKDLGVDKVIDYTRQNVVEEVMAWTLGEGVDITLDTVGPSVLNDCFAGTKVYGDVVSLLQPTSDTQWGLARKRNLRFSFELMLTPVMEEIECAKRQQANILEKCASYIDNKQLTVTLDRTFTLEEAATAQEYLIKTRPKGKIALVS